jgi:hypothetical protein
MAFHLRANFSDFFLDLLPALDSVYMQAKDLDEQKAAYKSIFAVRESDQSFENVSGISGFDVFQNVGEAEEVPLMSIAQLWDKKFTHLKWAGAYGISEEMTDDDNFEIVSSLARAHARAFRYTKEVDLAGVLNNGGTASLEASADGSAIFATHTLYDSSTKANTVATDFGVAAAQTMFNHFATLVDDRGHDINLSPKYIVANPAMKWVIKETMESSYKPFVMTNEVNALNDEDLTNIFWARITDTDAWYVSVDPSDLNGNGLRLYNRQDFTTSNDFDVKNLTMFVVGRGRWSRGCIDWRQVYRSTGA